MPVEFYVVSTSLIVSGKLSTSRIRFGKNDVIALQISCCLEQPDKRYSTNAKDSSDAGLGLISSRIGRFGHAIGEPEFVIMLV